MRTGNATAIDALRGWSPRRWWIALIGTAVTALLLGLPTDVIPNPIFGRQGTPVTWWSYLALATSAALSGLLLATYVQQTPPLTTPPSDEAEQLDKPGKVGSLGALLTFFAIGCPICNKVVLLAVGTAGATRWFAPVQPWLGTASIVLLVWALRSRLRGEIACPVSRPRRALSLGRR